jgi:predicted GNAT family N-acyltransferase
MAPSPASVLSGIGRTCSICSSAWCSRGQGIGRELWGQVLSQLPPAPEGRMFTVNASLNAIALNEAFGFRVVGGVDQIDGVVFVPTCWQSLLVAA